MKKIFAMAAAALFSMATFAQTENDGVLKIKTVDGETTSILMKELKNIKFEKVVPLNMEIEISNITQTSMDVDFIMPAGCSKYLMATSETEFTGTDREVREQIQTRYNDVFTEGKFLRITPLKPNTQYYFYTLGFDTDGVACGIGRAQAKTLPETLDDFVMGATEVTTTDAIINIVPKDKTKTYFINVVSTDDRSKMLANYADLRTAELEYLKYCAEQYNCDLDYYLGQTLPKGDFAEYASDRNLVGTPLQPNTDYHIICFGIDYNGNFTTPLYEEKFTTADVTPSDNVITVNVTKTGYDYCDYTVTTTNDDPYIVDMQLKSTWEKALNNYGGDMKKTANELLKVVYGGYADNYTHTGNTTGRAENSQDARECVLIVCGFNGGATTDVQIIPVTKTSENN